MIFHEIKGMDIKICHMCGRSAAGQYVLGKHGCLSRIWLCTTCKKLYDAAEDDEYRKHLALLAIYAAAETLTLVIANEETPDGVLIDNKTFERLKDAVEKMRRIEAKI